MTRHARGRSHPEPTSSATDDNDTRARAEYELAQAVAELNRLKQRDLAAKRRGDYDDRPSLALQIFDLYRAIQRVREAHRG